MITPFTGLTIVTEPPEEPVTLAEVKAHCRIDITDDDTYLEGLITAARLHVENYLNRSLVQQTWEVAYDQFPNVIVLPKPKLITIDQISYVDAAGVTQVLADTEYQVDTRSNPGRVMPAYSKSWPSTYGYLAHGWDNDDDDGWPATGYFNAVVVRFTCGYQAIELYDSPLSSPPVVSGYDYITPIPRPIKQGILMLVAHLYENRESTAVVELKSVPMGWEMILYNYRIFCF